MRFKVGLAAMAVVLAAPAWAEGDAAVGEKEFNKCKACHAIIAADGTVIVKGGKVGPDLYGVAGRPAGSFPDYAYGPSLVAAGVKGLVWDEASFVSYVQDPTGFLRTYLDDPSAKGKMAFKLAKKGEDVYAYLVSVAPAVEPAAP